MSITVGATAQNSSIWIRKCINDSTNSYQDALQELSSGTKYANFSDDPTDATQATKLSTEINANTQIRSIVNVASNVVNLAEDSQETVISNLQRIRDLCMEAANGTYSTSDKDSILAEIKQRLSQIDSTANTISYNGVKLLNGDASNYTIQIGIGSTETMNLGAALIDVHVSQLGTGTNKNLVIPDTVNGSNWTSSDIAKYMDKIDSATSQLLDTEAKLGGYANSLSSRSDYLTNLSTNLTNHKSTISDTDTAQTSADLVKFQILQETAVNIFVQANSTNSMALSLLSKSS